MKNQIRSVAFVTTLMLTNLSAKEEDGGYIDMLVAALNEDGGWWKNGLSQPVELPADAKAEDVLKKAIEIQPKDSPHRAEYKILKVRKVAINDKPYVTILLEYPTGLVIFLCDSQFEGSWWNRFIVIPNEAKKPNKSGQATPRKPSD